MWNLIYVHSMKSCVSFIYHVNVYIWNQDQSVKIINGCFLLYCENLPDVIWVVFTQYNWLFCPVNGIIIWWSLIHYIYTNRMNWGNIRNNYRHWDKTSRICFILICFTRTVIYIAFYVHFVTFVFPDWMRIGEIGERKE